MQKQKKHTKEQHEGKYVKSPVRKSPKTEPKTINLNNEEFKEQITKEGEEINVKIVTMEDNKLENFQDLLTQTGQENKQLKRNINMNWN